MKKIILTFILSIVTITYSNNALYAGVSQADNEKANLHYGLALKALNEKQHEKANKYINKAISIDPNNSKFYNLRCECKNKLKDYEGAIEDCKKAINL